MTLLTLSDLAKRYKTLKRPARRDYLKSLAKRAPPVRGFQVYLGHANPGEKPLFLAASLLEELGITFILEPPELHAPAAGRGAGLRKALDEQAELFETCRSYLFIALRSDDMSRFFPWQCGCFEGRGKRAGILPVLRKDTADLLFKGEGPLSAYPFAALGKTIAGQETLWLMTDPKNPVNIEYWIARGLA